MNVCKVTLQPALALLVVALFTDAAAAQAPMSSEDKLIQMFDTQLGTLNTLMILGGTILTLLGVVAALWSWRSSIRQDEEQKKREADFREQAKQQMLRLEQLARISAEQHQQMTTITVSLLQQTQHFMANTAEQNKASVEKTNAVLDQTAGLISSMHGLTETAREGQELALRVKKDFEETQAQKKKAIEALKEDIRPFARHFNRFKPDFGGLRDKADAITQVQMTYGVRESELPYESFVIRGYFYTLVPGNYRLGAQQFDKALEAGSADTECREIALYNRGINRANLRQYKEAIEDFQAAEALNRENLFYRFYRLDTRLLRARSAPEEGRQEFTELSRGFDELRPAVEDQTADAACQPLNQRGLLVRVLMSHTSLCIWHLEDFAKAEQLLGHPWLKDDLFALNLRLVAATRAKKLPDPELLKVCLKKADPAYRRASELRSKILRGLIYAQCCKWAGGERLKELENLRPRLLGHTELLERESGSEVTVFSTLTQNNEPIEVIRSQIEGL